VVLGPFRGAIEVFGSATGTREIGPLQVDHLVPRIDALLLTGGSAFGLSAAGGVVSWLEERGIGFETPHGRVPIVPAMVIYDLVPGGPRPDAALARLACEAASDEPLGAGRVGVGAGARMSRALGPEGSRPGGVGGAALQFDAGDGSGRTTVSALAVVNALGDVAGAGAGDRLRAFTPVVERLLDAKAEGSGPAPGGALENTTLLVVATDAPLTRSDLKRVARTAGSALGRMIRPVGTPFDGDVVVALATGETAGGTAGETAPRELLRLATAAAEVAAAAIGDAARAAGEA
jgi:L-aminopeptidase/D-esterase-like protein